MALMENPHIPPNCEVHWAGFVSSTYALQSAGWEAALENAYNQSLNFGSLRMLLHHRAAGWTMYAECMEPYGSMLARSRPYESHMCHDRPSVFEVRQCRPDSQIVMIQSSLHAPGKSTWAQIDMHPDSGFEQVLVSKMNVFAPWRAADREIIVAPDQVADLLERISKLQEPELVAIQQRNRARDLRDTVAPIRHATIMSLAA